MAALVTLAEAKTQLRIAGTDHDTDVTQKMTAASDAVLRHIGGSRIVVDSLTSSGGVATVVTAVAHGLTNGDSVSIWGANQAAYNGTFTVTVTDATMFTVAVYGTPESPATGYVGLSKAQGWTDTTVPTDVKQAVLLLLTSFYENRSALDDGTWPAIERLLSSYRLPTMS